MGPPKWAAEGAESLRFGVLGPVRIWREGEAVSTGSPQQRALLAALLLRDGRTATASELIDALWGEDPPSQALAAIRTYASRLRKTLGPGPLVSESGGYAVRVPAGSLDLHVAQDLAAEAERARAAGDRSRARTLIGNALALWDGEPLASLPGPYAETQRLRLEEWRLQLLETRIGVDLEMGMHAEVVSELTALTAEHPLRERLRELLMLALYRCGRQAEALAVYADTRRLLADALGVYPRPALNELQARILQADPELGRPAESPEAAPSTALARPAQLPASVPDFTGRTSLVRDLIEALYTADASVMAVAAIAGIGGVGKTTLAVHVGHEARQHFPDGQLYVDLQGAYAQADSPEAVLGSFLRALGTPDAHIPDGLGDRAALYRSVLDGRRVLVVLDNARDASQIRHLLPGTAGCAALVTSRVRMVDLAGAHLVDLGAMSPEEALQLFTRIVGEERVQAERKAALDVVAACGFLPLAIRIAASRLAARRTWTVSVLAAKLADERRRLDELQAGDLAVKATLELGYGQLPPAQARAFRLLGLAEGPDVSLAAAAAVLDLPLEETEGLLEALVDTSLLESAGPGRYRYDDLVRLYARTVDEMHRAGPGQGRRGQSPSEGEAALARLLDFYLATTAHAYAIERPGDALVDHLEPTFVQRLEFTDRNEARDWLYTEASCLLACARQSTSPHTLRRAADLLWTALDLAESGANSREYEATATALRDAALEQGDVRAERRILVALSSAHEFAGHLDEADSEAELVLSLGGADQDRLPACWATHIQGLVAVQRQRPDAAEPHFHQTVAGFREVGDRAGEARALSGQARVRLQTGNTIHALVLAERSTAMFDDMGNVVGAAGSRYTLGLALAAADRLTEAVQELLRALAVFRESGHRLWEGTTHYRLAAVQLAADRPTEAALHAEQALARGCVGGMSVRAGVLTVLGRSLDALGQSDRARACWREALTIHEQAGNRRGAEMAGLHSLISRGLRSA
ncbi:BTAD domain-containing putative transcriptional regulator [Streptomyces sp. NPDC050732]|uniref:AfsR/SARP family transcriptional regulator n=1 Tax=Streptomyces sp. NPDC050732 TaxID=3154632 RepID=UPI003446787F